MITIFSHFVMTPQVNCLAHQAERGCNGEDKCTAVSLAKPDKNLKMFWCFRVLKKQAQSGFPNDKCFPGSPGWIYTATVIFQLPFFTVQPTLSYLCWNSILKRPKKELFSRYVVTIFPKIISCNDRIFLKPFWMISKILRVATHVSAWDYLCP